VRPPAFRHVAAAACSDTHFLTAEFEHRVRLWSMPDRTAVSELDTVLDFGGIRLALCGTDSAPIIVAGAWERHGVCAYAADGTLLWQRKDLRQPQHIAPASGGTLVVACSDYRPAHVVTAEAGETVAKVRAVRRFYDSRFADVGLGEVYEHVVLVGTDDWEVRWKAPIEGFGILAAAAAPGAFTIAGTGQAPVTCLSVDGEPLWRWLPPSDVNCPALAWDAEASNWLGVLNHVNNERPDTLVRWSQDGEIVSEHPLALFTAYDFLPSGRYLVTSDGGVHDTRDGRVVWQLPTDASPASGS
jgi:outer membrane protein assembly factor BamB